MPSRLVENAFFFGLLALVLYVMWSILAPFVGALALSAIIATVCYPAYKRLIKVMPRQHAGVAAFVSVLLVLLIIFVPLSILGYILFVQAATFYGTLEGGSTLSIEHSLVELENFVQQFIPAFSIDVSGYVAQAASWLASNTGAIFAGTASTIFLFFITLIGLFYMFRDGEFFTKQLVRLSPLPDSQDTYIIKRLSRSVRSVVLGTLTVAIIQGTLTAIGFSIFGIEQAVLWGSVAAIGALIPGVGTSIVFIPAVLFLLLAGSYGAMAGLAVWGLLAVGLVDNLLGPYLVSRGTVLHPFFILLSVLGGISLFGVIGFVIGPVTLSLLMVLFELYSTHTGGERNA